jgi:hypothetical protein
MYFCGNPFLTSQPRQVSPVFELLTFAVQMERVCSRVHIRRDSLALLNDHGEKYAADWGTPDLCRRELGEFLVSQMEKAASFSPIAIVPPRKRPISGNPSV